MSNIVDRTYEILNKNNIYPEEVWLDSDLPVVYVQIHMGDWKHEHLRTRLVLEDTNEYHFVGNQVVDDTGEDVYTAVHSFIYEN